MSVESKVKEIVIKKLSVEPDEVTPEASFIDNLGADSLDLVDMIMDMEEEFDVEIVDKEAEKLLTVQDAVNFIKALL